eukprot:TRINITY_DN51088_c0_g1_i1.p1 TRINITY_DN51088_c0_g1~~TRINITY_DN51088_c0_g1_i1.p1  ORF type:complete len:394 (+),score=73.35 TRINITY_DN51088_c0_g1_i1:75-1184(+)
MSPGAGGSDQAGTAGPPSAAKRRQRPSRTDTGAPPAKRRAVSRASGRRRLVDRLAHAYGEDWQQWLEFMRGEGAAAEPEERAECRRYVRQFRDHRMTLPTREGRHAYRKLEKLLRPQQGQLSTDLSYASASASGKECGSPLMLPQLAADVHPAYATGALPVPAAACTAAVVACCAATRWRPHKQLPPYLQLHSKWHPPPCADHFYCDAPQLRHFGDPHDALCVVLRPLVELACSAFVNTRGGLVAVGVDDDGIVCGLPMNRTQRDRARRAVDSFLERWTPPCDTRRLVDLRFVEVRSAAGRVIQAHYVMFLLASALKHRQGGGPVCNAAGQALRWSGDPGHGGCGNPADFICAVRAAGGSNSRSTRQYD